MQLPRLDFNGRLHPQHRQRIKYIRETFGLTYKDFATLIGCDWSTILKWENGSSMKSQGFLTLALQQVFDGKLDQRLDSRRLTIKGDMERKLNALIRDRKGSA